MFLLIDPYLQIHKANLDMCVLSKVHLTSNRTQYSFSDKEKVLHNLYFHYAQNSLFILRWHESGTHF